MSKSFIQWVDEYFNLKHHHHQNDPYREVL